MKKELKDEKTRIVELDEDYRKISEMYIAEQTKAAKYEQRIKEFENDNADLRVALDIDPRCGTTPKDLCNKIKELEAENKRLQQMLLDCNTQFYIQTDAYKELKSENAQLRQANFDCNAHFNTLKEDYEELKKQVPKWVSVKDRLPMKGQYVIVAGTRCSLYPIDVVCWREVYIKNDAVHHWMLLPLPPTTEKENV